MKKTIIVLITLIALTMGGLYNTLAQLDNVEPETTEHTSATPFPHEMPDIIVDPMIGVPLYQTTFSNSEGLGTSMSISLGPSTPFSTVQIYSSPTLSLCESQHSTACCPNPFSLV